jgi:L-fuculose-phosphate aldolase
MSNTVRREQLLQASQRTVALGLNQGTSGNVSVRDGDGFLITPTGMACDALTPSDLVKVSLHGALAPGQRAPSSEWRLHRDIYLARQNAGAVVHAHPRFCTTLACRRQNLPAVHYLIAVAGASVVRCSSYATFGTDALSVAALEALGSSRACLLANHGVVTVGRDLEEAVRVAAEVELVAEYFWRASQGGEPILLSEREMTDVLERFKTYGEPRP